MANESDASGVIIFKATKKEHTNNLLRKLIKQTSHWYYCELHIDEDILEENNLFDTELPFTSSGRWTFINSLSHFFESFSSNELDPYPKNKFLQDLIGLVVNIDFVDYEMGCQTLYSADITLVAIEKDKNITTELTENQITDYEINAKNLRKFEIFDFAADNVSRFGLNHLINVLEDHVPQIKQNLRKEPNLRTLLINTLLNDLKNDKISSYVFDSEDDVINDFEDPDSELSPYISNILLK